MSLWTKVIDFVKSHSDFLAKAFSDNGQPSASRLMTIPHSMAAVFVLIYLTIKTQKYPGVDEATGLAAFSTAHYAVNRVSNMFGNKQTVVSVSDTTVVNKDKV